MAVILTMIRPNALGLGSPNIDARCLPKDTGAASIEGVVWIDWNEFLSDLSYQLPTLPAHPARTQPRTFAEPQRVSPIAVCLSSSFGGSMPRARDNSSLFQGA